MRKLSLVSVVFVAAAMFSACNPDSSPVAPAVNLTGNWLITATIVVHPAAPHGTPAGVFAVAITQSGTRVSGTVPAVAGQITGEIRDHDFVFTLVQQQPPCVLNGRATVDPSQRHLTGFYAYESGSCSHPFEATFTADKQ